MKKLISYFLITILLLTGCSNKNPAEANFDKFFIAFKNLDYKELNNLVISNNNVDQLEKETNQKIEPYKELLGKIKELIKDTSYKINSSKQEGDSYILDITIKAKDFSPKIEDAFSHITSTITKYMLNPNMSEKEKEETNKETITSIINTFSKASDFVETKTQVKMKKVKDTYKLDFSNQNEAINFINACFPKVKEKLEKIFNNFNFDNFKNFG